MRLRTDAAGELGAPLYLRGSVLASSFAQARLRADCVNHPLLDDGFRRVPNRVLRIELTGNAFDDDHCLLQHHELRLHLHVEEAGHFKQL